MTGWKQLHNQRKRREFWEGVFIFSIILIILVVIPGIMEGLLGH